MGTLGVVPLSATLAAGESPCRSTAAAAVARRCGRPAGWAHLGCAHAGPSKNGQDARVLREA